MSIERMNRRVFLRGLGTVLALPALEWAMPKKALASETKPPRRLGVFFVPNGMNMAAFTPSGEGSDYELSRILQPLAPYKNDMLVVSGLASLQSEGGDPHLKVGSMLTGVPIIGIQQRKATTAFDMSDPDYGISMDQLLARAVGGLTPFPSLELGTISTSTDCGELFSNEEFGGGEAAYVADCAYMWNISFANIKSPMPKETNPKALFDRLFGSSILSETDQQRQKRIQDRQSVLDFVREDLKALNKKVGVLDRRRLDEYATGLFEIEKRLYMAPLSASCSVDASGLAGSYDLDSNDTITQHVRAMMDLIVLAFRCDLTRVVTYMLDNGRSESVFSELGIYAHHHGISHHRESPDQLELLNQIGEWEMEQLGYLLGQLQGHVELDGSTLLDNSMVLGCSPMGDGHYHFPWDLPIVLAGRGGGAINPGRHISFPVDEKMPLANLQISLMQAMGMEISEFGVTGTGPLTEIG